MLMRNGISCEKKEVPHHCPRGCVNQDGRAIKQSFHLGVFFYPKFSWSFKFSNNLVENLLVDFEYEVQKNHIYYIEMQPKSTIYGFTIQENQKRLLISSAGAGCGMDTPKCLQSQRCLQQKELEAVPTMAVIDGPLEPPLSTMSNVTDVPDDPCFMKFFSAAMTMGNASNMTMTGLP
ncbi:hypothetical protein NMG60_11033419 [Bertholletia excelsa]